MNRRMPRRFQHRLRSLPQKGNYAARRAGLAVPASRCTSLFGNTPASFADLAAVSSISTSEVALSIRGTQSSASERLAILIGSNEQDVSAGEGIGDASHRGVGIARNKLHADIRSVQCREGLFQRELRLAGGRESNRSMPVYRSGEAAVRQEATSKSRRARTGLTPIRRWSELAFGQWLDRSPARQRAARNSANRRCEASCQRSRSHSFAANPENSLLCFGPDMAAKFNHRAMPLAACRGGNQTRTADYAKARIRATIHPANQRNPRFSGHQKRLRRKQAFISVYYG